MTENDKDPCSGLIRLHILHHAAKEPVYGSWFIEEFHRHGYQISPGTHHQMLNGRERKGCLRPRQEDKGKRARRFYAANPTGIAALSAAKEKVKDLFGELLVAGDE